MTKCDYCSVAPATIKYMQLNFCSVECYLHYMAHYRGMPVAAAALLLKETIKETE